jgi:mRNA interferase MazF
MVRQGDIIALDFSPAQGHEQSRYRPALVISRDFYNTKTGYAVICPITNNLKPFPMKIILDERTKTTGAIICEQIRTIDITARNPKHLEKIPDDLLQQVVDIVLSIFESNYLR